MGRKQSSKLDNNDDDHILYSLADGSETSQATEYTATSHTAKSRRRSAAHSSEPPQEKSPVKALQHTTPVRSLADASESTIPDTVKGRRRSGHSSVLHENSPVKAPKQKEPTDNLSDTIPDTVKGRRRSVRSAVLREDSPAKTLQPQAAKGQKETASAKRPLTEGAEEAPQPLSLVNRLKAKARNTVKRSQNKPAAKETKNKTAPKDKAVKTVSKGARTAKKAVTGKTSVKDVKDKTSVTDVAGKTSVKDAKDNTSVKAVRGKKAPVRDTVSVPVRGRKDIAPALKPLAPVDMYDFNISESHDVAPLQTFTSVRKKPPQSKPAKLWTALTALTRKEAVKETRNEKKTSKPTQPRQKKRVRLSLHADVAQLTMSDSTAHQTPDNTSGLSHVTSTPNDSCSLPPLPHTISPQRACPVSAPPAAPHTDASDCFGFDELLLEPPVRRSPARRRKREEDSGSPRLPRKKSRKSYSKQYTETLSPPPALQEVSENIVPATKQTSKSKGQRKQKKAKDSEPEDPALKVINHEIDSFEEFELCIG